MGNNRIIINFVVELYKLTQKAKQNITHSGMKKSMTLSAILCAALVMASCGSSKESAYRKAYEKAQNQEQTTVVEQPQVVAPVVERQQTETRTTDNYDNVPVRSENVNVISGAGLKNFSVVVGSFGLRSNAEGLQSRLKNAGYAAQIVFNPANNFYRVVATTYDSKADAVNSRDALRSQYADAWILYKK